jgi:hypothetical protein
MAKIYQTARGVPIDMARLKLANENTIAVGNKKVNARGDLLGPGGKVIKTRAEIMAEKNKLHHSPIASDDPIGEVNVTTDNFDFGFDIGTDAEPVQLLQPTVDHDAPIAESSAAPVYVKPRGSFANAVASQTEVTQELLDPSIIGLGPNAGPSGPQRL